MPKMKTRKSARKRFQITKSGKVKATRANKRHILTKKSTKRKRQLRRQSFLQSGDAGLVRVLLPNG